MVDREVSLCLGPIYYVFGVCLVLSRKEREKGPLSPRRPSPSVLSPLSTDNSTLNKSVLK